MQKNMPPGVNLWEAEEQPNIQLAYDAAGVCVRACVRATAIAIATCAISFLCKYFYCALGRYAVAGRGSLHVCTSLSLTVACTVANPPSFLLLTQGNPSITTMLCQRYLLLH